MADAQYTIDNSDRGNNNSFVVPGDEDGGAGDDSFATGRDDRGMSSRWYIHIDNGWDTSVDVTPKGSHIFDSSMSSSGEDGSAVTISSSDVDFIDGETGHSFLELKVNPSSAPTSGQLTITFQSREW